MKISFIVTTYNVAPYIAQCLDSLTPCMRPGDQLIVVDDGSTDDTPELITAALDAIPAEAGLTCTPVYFGTNTHGGVGIAGNIGLDEARGEAVFFVDGDDYLDPVGFTAARTRFEAGNADILIANYQTEDSETGKTADPADTPLWTPAGAAGRSPQHLALAMISVPWRKFYRREMLEQAPALRYPEGDFFFEDNPFHWDVCLRAQHIEFCNQRVCFHRVKRQGQTMQSRGNELAAIFTHYDTIRAKLSPRDHTLAVMAMRWLLGNISWQLGQLSFAAGGPYALRAAAAIQAFDEDLWQQQLLPMIADHPVATYAHILRHEGAAAFLTLWRQDQNRQSLDRVERALSGLQQRLQRLESSNAEARDLAAEARHHGQTLVAQQDFAARRALLAERPDVFDTPAVIAASGPPSTLWIGAHKTGTTFLQHCLEASRAALQDHGIAYPGLEDFRRDYTRPLLQPGSATVGDPAGALTSWEPHREALIFDENIPALVQNALAPAELYPQAETRLQQLIAHLGLQAPRLVLGIRSLDTFLPSLYCEAMKSTPYRPFNAFLPGDPDDPDGWSWSNLVHRLRAAFPNSELLVYRAEDLPGQERRLLAQMTGIPEAELTLADSGQRHGFSQAAIDALDRQYAAEGSVSLQGVRDMTRRHPKGEDAPGFMPFDAAQRAALQARYGEDLGEVNCLLPG